MNGRGPRAWNHHWLLIPLHDRGGRLVGVIWVDEPEDRLQPSTERLQALRLFANQASTAVASASQFEEMRFLADHDPLTRLGNRRAFIRRLGVEADRTGRYERAFALVVCDVDDFKALNDRRGHMAGDAALVRIGQVMRDALRRSDGAFRLGGDEFALMLVETGPVEAREVVDRIAEGLAEIDGGRPGGLHASFGVAVAAGGSEDPEALLRDADEAMYAAKRAGERLRFA
jgi:diguanylate cyclase (GGDEF)-like protein